MEIKEPDVNFFDNDYKQLPSNTKIGDPTKTGRYCEVCQGYLP